MCPYPYFKSLFVVHYELLGSTHQTVVLAGKQELFHILAGTVLSNGTLGFMAGCAAPSLLCCMPVLGEHSLEESMSRSQSQRIGCSFNMQYIFPLPHISKNNNTKITLAHHKFKN